MRLRPRNLALIFLPVALITGLDFFIKKLDVATAPSGQFLFFKLQAAANSGDSPHTLQIPMVSLGFFLLVCLYFVQLFAPVKSQAMRLAIAIYFGGVIRGLGRARYFRAGTFL